MYTKFQVMTFNGIGDITGTRDGSICESIHFFKNQKLSDCAQIGYTERYIQAACSPEAIFGCVETVRAEEV